MRQILSKLFVCSVSEILQLSMDSAENPEQPQIDDIDGINRAYIESFIQTCPLLIKKQHSYSERRLSVSGRNALDSVILAEALVEYQHQSEKKPQQTVTCKSLFRKLVGGKWINTSNDV